MESPAVGAPGSPAHGGRNGPVSNPAGRTPIDENRSVARCRASLDVAEERINVLAGKQGTGSRGQGRLVNVTRVPAISGALLFRPTPHTDERGFFSRTFDSAIVAEAGIDPAGFVQDSVSRSVRGVVRGMHTRSGAGEAKLVRCSYGAVFDVIIDLRPESPTYRNMESFELRDTEQVSLYVPAGCAHGFQALTDPADVSYRIDRPHDPTEDVSIAFDDPELAIPWPLPVSVMSPRDRRAPSLAAALRELAGV